jgi:transposase
MIPIPSEVRVWIATGHTDMRRGMNSSVRSGVTERSRK